MNLFIWYAGLYSATAAVLKLAGFVLFLWFARILPVEGYAAFGLLYAVQTGIVTFALAGVVETVVGLLSEHRSAAERRALYASANNMFALAAVVASLIVVLAFTAFVRESTVSPSTLVWVTASGVLLAFSSFQAQIVRLEEKHFSSVLFSFVAPVAGLGGGFVAFVVDGTVASFFMGSAGGVSVALFGLWLSREGFYKMLEPTVGIRTLFRVGAPYVAIAFFGWLGGYGNNYVINVMFDPVEVARFTFVFTAASIMQLVATALNQVWSPRFFRITHEKPFEEVEKKNRLFFLMQGLALGIVGGGVVAVFPTAMKMLGGNLVAYQSMTLELALLLGGYVVLVPWWHCQNYYLAHGRGSELMRIVLITSGIGTIVWITLMWTLGPIGIYLGFVTQMLLRGLGVAITARRHWPVAVSWNGVGTGVLMILLGFTASTF